MYEVNHIEHEPTTPRGEPHRSRIHSIIPAPHGAEVLEVGKDWTERLPIVAVALYEELTDDRGDVVPVDERERWPVLLNLIGDEVHPVGEGGERIVISFPESDPDAIEEAVAWRRRHAVRAAS